MIEQCSCGSTMVGWSDYGKIYQYFQTMGNGPEEREVSEVLDTKQAPIYCRCMNCNKRFKITDIEKPRE